MATIVFDLDGTLADTTLDLIEAANRTFEHLGAERPLDPLTDGKVAVLAGGRAMLKHGFLRLGISKAASEIEECYQLLVAFYSEALCVHSRLYPGCRDALEALEASGARLAVCTNKPGVLAVPLLEQLGISGHFGAIVAADTLPVRKPSPEPLLEAIRRSGGKPAQSALIGDSVTDRETARAAGIASVLVTFGPAGRAVEALDPEALLDHFDDLKSVLAGLGY